MAANAPSARPTPVELVPLGYPVLDAPPLRDEDGAGDDLDVGPAG